jgi:hypothetical protein
MKKTILVLSCAGVILTGAAIFTTAGCSEEKAVKNEDNVLVSAITNNYAIPPHDILPQSQQLADTFSWKTFIAMCWPADLRTCGPDTSGATILDGKGPLVWESYLTSDEVFVAPPATPAPWCELLQAKAKHRALPKKVLELAQKTGVYRFINRTSKSPHALGQASGQPLVDQNGRFVRYEVRMNKEEYDYITTNSLWNVTGQQNYTKNNKISFPTSASSVGPMEFKAAWKILGAGDDATKFYTIKAIVFNDDSLNLSPGPNPVTLGLVGLHIAHKTPSQRFWVWSTFEQVDNLTTSFFNDTCKSCPINTPPSGGPNYKELGPDGKPLHKPTQVTRVNAIAGTGGNEDPFIDGINVYFQNLLHGSVWANYSLVSTQWLFNEDVFPDYLANTVQETYLQGPNPPAHGTYTISAGEQYFQSPDYHPFSPSVSSSCMGCHSKATLNFSPNASADFSFLLGEAK